MGKSLSNRSGLEVIRKLFIFNLPFVTLTLFMAGILVVSMGIKTTRATELPFGEGVFWQISKDGHKPSILLGTLHSSERRVVSLGASALPLLASSDQLLVDVRDDDSIKQKLFSAMVYQDNRRLDELVSPETFEKIKVLGYEYGYLARQMKVLKPWAAGVVFSFPPSEASRISLGIRTLNQTLQDAALQENIEIVALETVEEQLATLDAANEQEQVALLDSLPDSIGAVEEKFNTTLDLYLSQDTAGLYRQMQQGYTAISEDFSARYVASLVTRRNYRMVERLEPALLKGNSFIAVDALHLPGTEGVLSLLQAKGYTLRPMR